MSARLEIDTRPAAKHRATRMQRVRDCPRMVVIGFAPHWITRLYQPVKPPETSRTICLPMKAGSVGRGGGSPLEGDAPDRPSLTIRQLKAKSGSLEHHRDA